MLTAWDGPAKRRAYVWALRRVRRKRDILHSVHLIPGGTTSASSLKRGSDNEARLGLALG